MISSRQSGVYFLWGQYEIFPLKVEVMFYLLFPKQMEQLDIANTINLKTMQQFLHLLNNIT